MSIRIMTQVWDLPLPDSCKIVLLALADCANDEGQAWPSIASLCRKTSKSARTVQMVIGKLVEMGHVGRREIPGRGCLYAVHPRNDCTPAESAPPQPLRRTPAKFAGHPRSGCGESVKEPSRTVKGEARERAPTGPDGDSEGLAGDKTQAEARATRLPADWTPPPIDALPPQAMALVQQWPQGAYGAVCETFRLHWTAESGARAAKRDWGAALAKWLVNDHGKVMRDARAGVTFAPVRAVTAGQGAAAAPAIHQPVPQRGHECEAGREMRRRLAARLGPQLMHQWMEPCALVPGAAGVAVICPSEFVADWVERRFAGVIGEVAAGVCGNKRGLVQFAVEKGTPANG